MPRRVAKLHAGLALMLLVGTTARAAAQAEARADSAEAPSSSETESQARSPALEISAGPRAVHRELSYSDQVATLFPERNYPKLAPYQLALGPAAFASVELFPGAFTGRGLAAHLGVTLSYARAFATRLLFAQGTPYERTLDTRSSELFAGLKARLPLDAHELSLSAGYGQSSYELLGDEAQPVVPDVAYRYFRIDGAAKVSLGAPFLGLHAGTRLIADSGAVGQTWFAGAKTTCFEAGAQAGYRLSASFDVLLAFDLVRYGFDFNPIPPSANPWTTPVAGGAIDQYLLGSLALRYRFTSPEAPKARAPTGRQARSRSARAAIF